MFDLDHESACTEAVARKCSVKTVLSKISQNSQENGRASVLLKKDSGTDAFL